MAQTLLQLETATYDMLRETASDSHFTPSQLAGYLNLAQIFTADMGSPPDKNNLSSPIVTSLGTSTYTKPTDDLYIQSAYFGTRTTSNDITRMTVTTKDQVGRLMPNWLDTTSANYGKPNFLFILNSSTIQIAPAPDATNAGKNIYLFYGTHPTDMVSDSDTPTIAEPYHGLLPFYACRLAYYALSNPNMAKEMFAAFLTNYNLIKDNVNKEAEEVFRFKWGVLET